jgi:hypothetical protein
MKKRNAHPLKHDVLPNAQHPATPPAIPFTLRVHLPHLQLG